MPNMIDAALEYARLGQPVFPVANGSKVPLIAKADGGNGCLDATTDERQIRKWWTDYPYANIGGATGFLFDALDVDDGGEETLLGHDPIGKTPESATVSGGRHILFAPSSVPLKNAVKDKATNSGPLGHGLDFRTKGGYIVLPPSKTPQGSYRWIQPLNGHFEPVPDWIVEAIKREKESYGPAATLGKAVVEGSRNDSLFRFACRLRRNGLDALEIMGSLMAINRTRCNPPLTETELGKIAESAAKYQAMPDDLQDTTVDVPEEARSGWIGEFQTEGIRTGCASGIGFIDDNTQVGGFSDAQMSVISAYTGFGKTTFMLQCALNVARRKETVGYVTFADFTAADLYDRLVTMVSGWKGRTPPAQSEELYNLWHMAREEVNTLPIIVYDASESKAGRSVERYAEWMQKYPQMRICFNDYAQEMRSDNPRVRGQFEHAEECCGILRWLAATTKVPIVVGSQLTEGNEKAGTRDTTKGSRVWEERCALHMKIRRFTEKELAKLDQEYATIPGIAEWNIVKNRHGKSMIRTYAQFSEKYLRFIEL